MRCFTDRDAAFFHRFQQCRLRLRRGAVHFVGQHDVGKDRSRLKLEKLLAHRVFLNDVRSGDVGRHEIRRELDTGKLQVHDVAQRGNQLRFSQPRHAFQKNVSAGEQTHDDAIDDFAVADDDLARLRL